LDYCKPEVCEFIVQICYPRDMAIAANRLLFSGGTPSINYTTSIERGCDMYTAYNFKPVG
jgi:hypothetical protein